METQDQIKFTLANPPNLEDFIIYDDDGIIAINKPTGMVSQGGFQEEFSIAQGLDQLTDRYDHKPHLVHRLDRYTSGVMLLATSKNRARSLGNAFRKRTIQKEYWALIDGIPDAASGTISAAIRKGRDSMSEISHDGKAAETAYNVFESNSDSAVSFLGLKPLTGRRHQLRVHTALCMGMPILGDRDYHPFYHPGTRLTMTRDFSASSLDENVNSGMVGQMLHAHSIRFLHPGRKEETEIKVPLPENRAAVWKKLGFNPVG